MANGDDNNNQKLDEFQNIQSLAINETQLVWGRFNVMLAANAFIAVVLGAIITKNEVKDLDWIILCFFSLAGVVLCVNWYHLTKYGWTLTDKWGDEAKKYTYCYYKSPYAIYEQWCKDNKSGYGWNDKIAFHAKCVIGVFSFIYIFSILCFVVKIYMIYF